MPWIPLTYKAAVRLEKRISHERLVDLSSCPLVARIADRSHCEGGTEAGRNYVLGFLSAGERRSSAVGTDLGRFEHRLMVAVFLDGYDVTEFWHKSHLTMVGRRPSDRLGDTSVPLELEIVKVFFEQTTKRLLPVTGSPRAHEEARLANEPLAKRLLRRIRSPGDSWPRLTVLVIPHRHLDILPALAHCHRARLHLDPDIMQHRA